MQNKELVKRIEADGVKFLSLQFTDLLGTVKSVDIPSHRVPNALEQGVCFDGSSVEGFARIQESDMHLHLDASTYQILPWSAPERRRARALCDIYNTDGTPFEGDPRYILKKQLARAKDQGYSFNVGPELEFFLLKPTNGPLRPSRLRRTSTPRPSRRIHNALRAVGPHSAYIRLAFVLTRQGNLSSTHT